MNTKTKLILTAVMATAVLTFSPQALRAQGMGDSQGMMNDKSSEATDVAIQGFCPVCVINGTKVKGKENISTEYNGKTYYFAGEDQKKMFLVDPEKYTADLENKFNSIKDDNTVNKNHWEVDGSH